MSSSPSTRLARLEVLETAAAALDAAAAAQGAPGWTLRIIDEADYPDPAALEAAITTATAGAPPGPWVKVLLLVPFSSEGKEPS